MTGDLLVTPDSRTIGPGAGDANFRLIRVGPLGYLGHGHRASTSGWLFLA